MDPSRYLPRPLPHPLDGLAQLALDLRWLHSGEADALWSALDPALWRALGNPWLILETVSQQRLAELATDPAFRALLQRSLAAREAHLGRPTWWFTQPREARGADGVSAAFFSMEFGLSDTLPIYSGGLGILAGDFLRAASDLGVPLVGVGLLYQVGYFRQTLDRDGNQLALFPYNDPTMMPVLPLRDARGEWLHAHIELPGRTLRLRAWFVQVGRVALYLLDSNDPLNSIADRGLTAELYGGDRELRLQQELILGVGGVQLLDQLGVDPTVLHLNEGHSAFAALERARLFKDRAKVPFFDALRCTRAGNVFTTHTAVAAGIDSFAPGLAAHYLAPYADRCGVGLDALLALGRADADDAREPFNMAFLALHASGGANAVSRLHEQVSQRLFATLFPRWPEREIPIGHVTNGVHVPSWDSRDADAVWTKACGESRWLGDLDTLEADFRALPDGVLWQLRTSGRQALVDFVRERVGRQRAAHRAGAEPARACETLLDPDALTLGFARRFATYKRPHLLLHDRARLARLLTHRDRPVQLVIAGKAHPDDSEGKRLVRDWVEFMAQPEVCQRAVYIEDYDLAVAARLVQGVDVWINTPRRPWEASGTSGMKVLVNGGLNLSTMDGWWAEAYEPQVGWALGDGRDHDDGDAVASDTAEAQMLFEVLEREVVPAFYDRDASGVPTAWVTRMRESMARLTGQYSANRMVREYVGRYYVPAAAATAKRCAGSGTLGRELEQFCRLVERHWSEVRFGALAVKTEDEHYHRFDLDLFIGALDPASVRVELYAEPTADSPPAVIVMDRVAKLVGSASGFRYTALVPSLRPPGDYCPRARPYHPALTPLEAPEILWHH